MNPENLSLSERVALLQGSLRETPVVELAAEGIRLHAKLEHANPFGSLKDRPAFWILKSAVESGEVTERTTLIESSSGNFANAMASYCRLLGLEFIPVIDPNIAGSNEAFLQRMCKRVVKVQERDETGGFLKTRLRKVQELCKELEDTFWPNQYGNPKVAEAHYRYTGEEICRVFKQLDYVFVGVSTGGTIAGVSQRLKERFPSVKVIAVDAEGSVIFGGPPKKRHIPGIGASVRAELVDRALIDEVVNVPEVETVRACRELLYQHGLLVGGSSGSCYAAVKRYLPRMRSLSAPPQVLFLCADKGGPYLDTVFNDPWCARLEQ
ncbi:2,3-diaminopropionate biosynthesis protein SbnA [Vitiosangium sp. GDMCC 1.1324]|uniref:2,3-diaminopropionate biosynthesis protein SbnA n=1 Tax=Vitiosangium sp. (strain GDMCC 1.1324) TaxID=2138576 RepID=UPI000D351F1E|nr:2,3-diaminopropionate biosynthesis protein SbnA [Vitiosangium sp. GDMCC 1.1324]PTL80711.1 2,3-diaminopropionate biosynthesis protein SbnA [Vitiosangium sp. GDMCC 1.1324]